MRSTKFFVAHLIENCPNIWMLPSDGERFLEYIKDKVEERDGEWYRSVDEIIGGYGTCRHDTEPGKECELCLRYTDNRTKHEIHSRLNKLME